MGRFLEKRPFFTLARKMRSKAIIFDRAGDCQPPVFVKILTSDALGFILETEKCRLAGDRKENATMEEKIPQLTLTPDLAQTPELTEKPAAELQTARARRPGRSWRS